MLKDIGFNDFDSLELVQHIQISVGTKKEGYIS